MPTLSFPSARSVAAVVRPNVVIESHLRDRTPRPVAVPEQEAEIRWGQPSSFQWSVTSPPKTGGGGVVVRPRDDEDDPEGEAGPITVIYEEIGQLTVTEDVRVENPDDESQYVIVERILDIQWLTPPNLLDALTALRDGNATAVISRCILHPADRPGSQNSAN